MQEITSDVFYDHIDRYDPNGEDHYVGEVEYHLLLVPTDDFGYPGYVRLSYCVSTDMIKRSLPAFRQLAEEYGIC